MQPTSNYILAIGSICLSTFLATLLVHSSTIAIPAISRDLGISADQISWLPLGLVLGNAICQFPAARLGERFGKKSIYLAGLYLGILASLLAGIADNSLALIAARFLHGAGNAMIFGAGLALIFDLAPEDKRTAYTGWTTAAAYVGITSGPLVGGIIIEHLSWRWVFLLPAPLFLLTALPGQALLPARETADSKHKLDISGTALYAGAMILLAIALSDVTGDNALLLGGLGCLTMVIFLVHQQNATESLLDLDLMHNNRAFSMATIVIFLFQVTIYSIPYALTLFLQYVHALEPREAGFILMLQAICTVCTTLFTDRLVSRFSYGKVIYAGLATGLAAVVLLALVALSPNLYLPILALVLAGIAAGLIETPLTSLMMGSVGENERGSASATMFTMRMLGAFASVGIISILLGVYLGDMVLSPASSDSLITAIASYFALSTVTLLAAIVCFRLTVRAHRRSQS